MCRCRYAVYGGTITRSLYKYRYTLGTNRWCFFLGFCFTVVWFTVHIVFPLFVCLSVCGCSSHSQKAQSHRSFLHSCERCPLACTIFLAKNDDFQKIPLPFCAFRCSFSFSCNHHTTIKTASLAVKQIIKRIEHKVILVSKVFVDQKCESCIS